MHKHDARLLEFLDHSDDRCGQSLVFHIGLGKENYCRWMPSRAWLTVSV